MKPGAMTALTFLREVGYYASGWLGHAGVHRVHGLEKP
jgi:hypothetical protein